MPIQTDPNWCRAMIDRFKTLPGDYVVYDIETLNFDKDTLILQLGQVVVKDWEIVHQTGVYLDWVGAGLVRADWLRAQLDYTRTKMAADGKVYRMVYDTLHQQGMDPRQVFAELNQTLELAGQSQWPLVGVNLQQFDLPRLAHWLHHFLGVCPEHPADLIFDAGAMEKSRQLADPPYRGETTAEWCYRVRHRRAKGVKWSLDTHCAGTHDLWTKSGLSPLDAHDAEDDAVLTHHLFKAFHQILEDFSAQEESIA